MLIWYISLLQLGTTVVLVHTSYYVPQSFFLWWEQLRSNLLATLKLEYSNVVYSHYASIPFIDRETEIQSSGNLFTVTEFVGME